MFYAHKIVIVTGKLLLENSTKPSAYIQLISYDFDVMIQRDFQKFTELNIDVWFYFI